MKLLRRKKDPTLAEKVLGILRNIVRALAAVRFARSAYGTYKFARRLPLIIGLAAAGAAIFALVKRARGGDEGDVETWSPSSAPAPSPSPAPAAAGAADAGPELTPNPAETAGTGTPSPDLEAAPPPSVSATAGDEVADAPGSASEADTEKA